MNFSKRNTLWAVLILIPLMVVIYQNTSQPYNARAEIIFNRLTGKPPSPAQLAQMQALIDQNQLGSAAKIALQDPDFINTVIRNYFCAPMSVRALTADTPFNDFTATCMGIIRDNTPITDLLLGNYLYRIDPTKVPANLNIKVPDPKDPANLGLMTGSNDHYTSVSGAEFLFDIGAALYKEDGQRFPVPPAENQDVSETFPNPDPAGVITSFTFMSEECIAGTNRRCVEYVFRDFLCRAPTDFADNGLATGGGDDSWVGMDVDRFPGNDHNVYETTCKSCHNILDSARGAFAYFDVDQGYGIDYTQGRVQSKYSRNNNVYPMGHQTVDTRWVNNAVYGNNATYFGWQGPLAGTGVRAFATMVSKARAFPECMVKRAIKAVCLRDATFDDLSNIVVPEATALINDNYNLANLFGRIATNPNCIGAMVQK